MRSKWSFTAIAIVAGLSFAACAQSVADDGIFDNDAGAPDPTVDAGVDDATHHDYGSHDAGASGDTGGGNAGDTGTPGTDGSTGADGGAKDSGGGHDSGGSTPDTGAPDTGTPPTGGTTCGSNSKYLTEYLAALLDPNAVACTDGSECSSVQCCEISTCVGL